MNTISPTLYPDVNEILILLLTSVKEILQDQFTGMYLFGSLANGDFDQHSDIDVLVLTNDEISETKFSALKEMHDRIAKIDSPWAIQLEVSYIPKNAIRRFDTGNNFHPHIDRGDGEKLHMMAHVNDWIIQRHILRERAITITGLDLQRLIDLVSQNDLRQAVVDVLPLWAIPILEDPSQIDKRGYQSFFVLSLCRMLYTMKHGEIVSKPFAAKWATDTLDAKWTPLIERAWIGRHNPGLKAQPEDVNGTLDLIRYTLAYSRQIQDQTNGTQYPESV
jgi:predicted nucleotidyltransferase